MKNPALLLISGCLIALASCASDHSKTTAQVKIDSIVDARVSAREAAMYANNDSIINALARRRADSILAAMHSKAGALSTPPVSIGTKVTDQPDAPPRSHESSQPPEPTPALATPTGY